MSDERRYLRLLVSDDPATSETVERGAQYPAACPDCPGSRLGVLESLVGATKEACAFSTAQLGSRQPIPLSWGAYGVALVRRGVVVRQRIDSEGHATAIDAAGPGCLLPFEGEAHGYAVGDVIVCLCPRDTLERSLRGASVGGDLIALHRAALARVERMTEARGASSGLRKVARCLITLAETLSPPRVRDDLPAGFQQRDLGMLIGMRHESVCRALGVLEREGLLERSGVGSIERLSLDGLRAV
ncbi:MAG: Crp/Fnr family transcriptional regulator [Sandaracinus sp.]|nr:Crp/Fnr family transcriptional regulator [Sandaracinus sp.]MCB9615947.1 Crp/Fnr family transcriptional regulator [Sandaracinus sp.]MCB9621393.1 Crp/Fnr family transcriptional regulator [Sandaracinus sp.]MCB9622876.1 Crp/Fnr family transcriptional regulator [Sandaracinus sp.]MCB9635270.1 Crp/Fnr family transcriptional regulator [Sandaracinus sp.]